MSAAIHPIPISLSVTYGSSAAPLLTPSVKTLLDGFVELLAEVAQEENVPIGDVRVSGVPPSDETPSRLLVTVYVALPAAGALAFWDTIGDAVEHWAAGLSPASSLIVLDRISLDVEWSENAVV